jgi:hypothetical protein
MLRGFRDNAAYEGGRYLILAILAAIWPTISGILHVFWNKPWYWKLNGALIAVTAVLFIIALWKLVRIGKSQRILSEGKKLQVDTTSEREQKLQIACARTIEGSVAQAWWTINGEPMPVNFFRIVVNATDESHLVKNCTGFLTRIEKDRKTKWGGNNVKNHTLSSSRIS